MIRLPGRGDGDDDDAKPSYRERMDVEPLVACEFQDGTLLVYEDHVHIERPSVSRFEDKSIAMTEITGVEFSKGIVLGYLQVWQVDFENDGSWLLSDPVDANTVHVNRSERDCATRARDAILERATG